MGGLNLYAHYPHAFGVIDRARGLLLAGIAALALTSARTHEAGERREANLHAGLASRQVIGQAEGILIERERITADQAFDMLRRASQHLHIKLRDVAKLLSTPVKIPTRAAAGFLEAAPHTASGSELIVDVVRCAPRWEQLSRPSNPPGSGRLPPPPTVSVGGERGSED